MLIPSIDFLGGRVVQLQQGERLVYESQDLDGWIAAFASCPIVQVIDLDAARGTGSNAALVRAVCARRTCQVGGGVRSPDDARRLIDAGASRVIVGSALFGASGVDIDAARRFAAAVPLEALIAAVDAKAGRVVVRGWRAMVPIAPAAAACALEPFAGAFLHTHVDGEGLMRGVNLDAVREVRDATSRRVIAAGGVRDVKDVDDLDAMGVDAVVGMAIYRGAISIGSR